MSVKCERKKSSRAHEHTSVRIMYTECKIWKNLCAENLTYEWSKQSKYNKSTRYNRKRTEPKQKVEQILFLCPRNPVVEAHFAFVLKISANIGAYRVIVYVFLKYFIKRNLGWKTFIIILWSTQWMWGSSRNPPRMFYFFPYCLWLWNHSVVWRLQNINVTC